MTWFGARRRHLLVAVFVAASTAGCFGESYGTPGMKIWNQTPEAIDVIYRRPIGGVATDDDVVQVGPNQQVLVVGLHQTEGPCLRGTVIAMQKDRIVATISQPCEGAEWVVIEAQGESPLP